MNRRITNSEYRPPQNPRSGSALILVLGLIVLLSVLIMGFGHTLRSDLKAAGAFYEESVNIQLARSAYTLAMREMARSNGTPYADRYGNLFFASEPESYRAEMNELQELRSGFAFGRGMLSYQFFQKPFALDPNELSLDQWKRLLEVACGIENEREQSELADSIMDWIDTDSNARDDGFEEDDYQDLNPPRHSRDAPLESIEELLLVYGMTEEMFYGYGLPVREESGILFGGGLYRFLVGDNSPAAETTVQYINTGVLPSEDLLDDDENRSDEFEMVAELPSKIYLIVRGFSPEQTGSDNLRTDMEINSASQTLASTHVMLIVFELPENGQAVSDYAVVDFQENATGGLLDAVLAYGVEE